MTKARVIPTARLLLINQRTKEQIQFWSFMSAKAIKAKCLLLIGDTVLSFDRDTWYDHLLHFRTATATWVVRKSKRYVEPKDDEDGE